MTTTAARTATASDLAQLAKALGHPARVRILQVLLSRDACYCGQIVDELPLAQATVSSTPEDPGWRRSSRGRDRPPAHVLLREHRTARELHEPIGGLLDEAREVDLDGCH